jgi:hypothetical protein
MATPDDEGASMTVHGLNRLVKDGLLEYRQHRRGGASTPGVDAAMLVSASLRAVRTASMM